MSDPPRSLCPRVGCGIRQLRSLQGPVRETLPPSLMSASGPLRLTGIFSHLDTWHPASQDGDGGCAHECWGCGSLSQGPLLPPVVDILDRLTDMWVFVLLPGSLQGLRAGGSELEPEALDLGYALPAG